jgi:RNA polymerase sigma factor (sigma-70 family)
MVQDDVTGGDERFPATRWSVIEAIRSDDVAERRRALETLCEVYWKPVYKYVRLRWGRTADDAQDLTQGFFVKLLERELVNRFDADKSRLRTYLRLCVDSFVMNEGKAAGRQKRGGEFQHLVLDFAGAEEEFCNSTIDAAAIASPESLEEFFEKEWVRSLFTLAVEDLRALCTKTKRDRAFRFFEAYDLEGDDNISYTQLAEQYGVPVTKVTNTLAWTRREFRTIALKRLHEICGSDDEFQKEAKAAFGWDAR